MTRDWSASVSLAPSRFWPALIASIALTVAICVILSKERVTDVSDVCTQCIPRLLFSLFSLWHTAELVTGQILLTKSLVIEFSKKHQRSQKFRVKTWLEDLIVQSACQYCAEMLPTCQKWNELFQCFFSLITVQSWQTKLSTGISTKLLPVHSNRLCLTAQYEVQQSNRSN